MTATMGAAQEVDHPQIPSQKDEMSVLRSVESVPDSLYAWMERYRAFAIAGVRSPAITQKIVLHLDRFRQFFVARYGHDRLSTCLQRDVRAWQTHLSATIVEPRTGQTMAAATVNNHLAVLSGFTSWAHAQAPRLFPAGDPAKGIGELGLPPLEPRTLTPEQVQSLKNVCDRLPRFHQLRGRRWAHRTTEIPLQAHGRPWRDRAIVFVLLSTGLRREELVRLNCDQLVPATAAELHAAHRAQLRRVRGKGKTERSVYLSADARTALADYLERERPHDEGPCATALFLSAASILSRQPDGRLSVRAVNFILAQIGRWHDAGLQDPARHIGPLRPHDLRHTFAFHLARTTGADAYELERRLGHRSPRYIQRYTNPPADVAASYVEGF